MNNGAFIFQEKLLSNEEVNKIANFARELEKNKRSVHSNGKYADLKWFNVDLSPDLDYCKKILNALNVAEPLLLGFYYLDSGAKLHSHRDLTGASFNNRLRFHVPIITNPDVNFIVSNDRVKMSPGDLWCLDTSYLHSVENKGSESRVHIIIECDINDEIIKKIPTGLDAKLHNLYYLIILIFSFIKSIFINSIRDPKYFKDQISMVFQFFKWRFFRKTDGK